MAQISNFSNEYVYIEGLKDKELEDKINKILREKIETMMGTIPPYRGILAELGNDYDETTNVAYTYSGMNSGNVLSLCMSKIGEYKTGDDEISVADCETVNINLNTGEEIPFTDIFKDKEKGMENAFAFMKDYAAKNETEPDGEFEHSLVSTGPFRKVDTNKVFVDRIYEENTGFSIGTENLMI